MVPMAMLVGRRADTWGRKRLLLIGFAALPLHGVLYTLVHDPVALVAIQMLDGVGAGIFGALFPIVVVDVTEGSGRYNLAQGVSATAWGTGAALSNGVAGYFVDWAGYDSAFLFLAGCAAVALLVLWLLVPETRGWTRRAAILADGAAAKSSGLRCHEPATRWPEQSCRRGFDWPLAYPKQWLAAHYSHSHTPAMFCVSEAQAAVIRAAFELASAISGCGQHRAGLGVRPHHR
jgi:MFS family permease